MKPMKLEFVVFNISQENATFLWKSINRVIEFLGFDTTGKISEITEIDFDVEKVTEERWEAWKKIPRGGHAIFPGVDYHYSNEDEHKE